MSKKVLRGVCEFYSETGTEGGYWAFHENKYLSPYSLEGLRILKDGDQLTIFSLDNHKQVVWSGTISLRQYPPFTESVFGLWIHADQEGVDREVWAAYFLKEYPAELIPVNKS